MGWSGSGSRAPPAGAIDCLRNGVSSYPCFLLTVLFGLTALPLVWVVRDSRCSPGVLHGSGTGRPGGFRWRGQENNWRRTAQPSIPQLSKLASLQRLGECVEWCDPGWGLLQPQLNRS